MKRFATMALVAASVSPSAGGAAPVDERLVSSFGSSHLQVFTSAPTNQLMVDEKYIAVNEPLVVHEALLNLTDPLGGEASVAADGPELRSALSAGFPYLGDHVLRTEWTNVFDTRGQLGFGYTIDRMRLHLLGSGNPLAFDGKLQAQILVSVEISDTSTAPASNLARDLYIVTAFGKSDFTPPQPFTVEVVAGGLTGTTKTAPYYYESTDPKVQDNLSGLEWIGDPLTRQIDIAGVEQLEVTYIVDLHSRGFGADAMARAEFGDPLGGYGVTAAFTDDVAVVPVPGALPLLATGIAGLAWLRRRRAC